MHPHEIDEVLLLLCPYHICYEPRVTIVLKPCQGCMRVPVYVGFVMGRLYFIGLLSPYGITVVYMPGTSIGFSVSADSSSCPSSQTRAPSFTLLRPCQHLPIEWGRSYIFLHQSECSLCFPEKEIYEYIMSRVG